MRRAPAQAVLLAAVLAGAAAASCTDPAGSAPAGSGRPVVASSAVGPPAGWTACDPPAGPGALAPRFTVSGEDLLLTWLEPAGSKDGAPGHRLRLARLANGRWSEPVTVAAGTDFFANWADVPAVAAAPGGTPWHAAWLARTGAGTYDYSILTARSADAGATWKPAGMLHEPGPGEHGFVAFVPEAEGLRAFFLQGTEGKGTTLRTATLPASADPASPEVIDPLVCDCCPLDAALTPEGPVVVYRDRTPEEIRDIYLLRRTAEGWRQPVRVGADGWRIPGCPVNGPAVAAAGRTVAVAWFTGAEPGPRVQLAFSADGGATFGPAIPVDAAAPIGRVSLVLDGSDAIVGWLARAAGGRATLTLRRVAASGRQGEPLAVAETGAARASGIPRLARQGDRLLVAWVESGEPARLKAGALPLAALPAVPAP